MSFFFYPILNKITGADTGFFYGGGGRDMEWSKQKWSLTVIWLNQNNEKLYLKNCLTFRWGPSPCLVKYIFIRLFQLLLLVRHRYTGDGVHIHDWLLYILTWK